MSGFASPIFLLGLLLIPLLLAASWAARRRSRRYAIRFPAAPSLAVAAAGTRSLRRHIPLALALGALAVLTMAMAKPQKTVTVPVDRASIMLVTDQSRSMLATDVEPNRLRAAQSAARTFLDALPDRVRVGAVAYSDTPEAVQSPSENHDDARRVIDAQVADGGTATGDALQVALDTLAQERERLERRGERLPAAIVLLSDGKATVGRHPVEVARVAARAKVPVFTIALGTTDATVPNPGIGPPLPAPPDPETMAEIARVSGGRAFRAEDELRLQSIYEALGSRLGTKEEKRETTSSFAVAGLVLLLGAAGTGVAFGSRLP